MNIQPTSNYISFFIQESTPSSSLNPVLKKILIVASIAFACLLAYKLLDCCLRPYLLLNGPGKRKTDGGVTEEGTFKDGKLHGQGKSIASNYEAEGEFDNGALIKGKYIHKYPNGSSDTEKGEFLNLRLHGKGKRVTDECCEEGEFKDGKLHGQGERTFTNNEIMENGDFENGKLVFGKRSVSSPPHVFIEEGNFAPRMDDDFKCRCLYELHGKGKITFSDGTFLEGHFNQGVIKGKRTLPGGKILEGQFRHGELIKGKKIEPNGDVYKGTFDDGRFQKGKITYAANGNIRYIDDNKDIEIYPNGQVLDRKTDWFI